MLPRREQELPRHRLREIAVGLLDQPAILPVQNITVKSQLVGIARQPEEIGRLANQVERHVGQAEVHFQRRRVAAPFAQPLAQNERIITQPLAIIRHRRIGMGGACSVECPMVRRRFRALFNVLLDRRERRHQMCFTTSGMS